MKTIIKQFWIIIITIIIIPLMTVCDERYSEDIGGNYDYDAFYDSYLLFTLIDGPAYSVRSSTGNSYSHLWIPDIYKGLPVTTIESFGFYKAVIANNLTIPNSVTSIGDSAFAYCHDLWGVIIPNSVTLIHGRMFYLSSLLDITIPDSVTSIGYSAFEGCGRLRSIKIPNSVTSIGNSVFRNWTSSQTIHIPFASLAEANLGWGSDWAYNNAIIKNNAGIQVRPRNNPADLLQPIIRQLFEKADIIP